MSTPERAAWRATLDEALAHYHALPRARGDAWAILEGKLATTLARQRALETRLALADDTALHVYHGRVFADLLTNPLIVPVKVLRGHKVTDHLGIMACAFHPTLPWVFTAGADGVVHLYTD